MGKTAVAVIALVLSLVIGAIGAMTLAGGAMAGAGAAAGLSTGICSTTKAAQELGFLTPEQVDLVLNKAAEDISGKELGKDQAIVGTSAACGKFLAEQAD